MRDLGLLVVLGGLAWAAWRRPWLGVPGLAFVGFLHPQGYASSLLAGAPAYAALFAVTAAATLRDWRRVWPNWRALADWRPALIAALWGWFVLSTWQGVNPWVAWPKLAEVAKLLPPLLLVALLIDTRARLAVLLGSIGLAVGLAAVKGGYWALMTGFGDRVYGPPGSQFEDNNEFAVAAVMAIPLLAGWMLHATGRGLRLALGVVVALAALAVLSSWSRGGVLGLAVMGACVALHGRSRLAVALAALALAAGAATLLPAEWLARMGTLAAPAGEGSALSRLETWRLGLAYVAAHPVFGGGFEGWVFATAPNGAPVDWHSAYVEMAAEHGLPGLALWLALVGGTLAGLTRSGAAARRRGDAETATWAAMLRASLAGYVVGAAFLGIAYWELLYWLVMAAAALDRLAGAGAPPQPGAARAAAVPARA